MDGGRPRVDASQPEVAVDESHAVNGAAAGTPAARDAGTPAAPDAGTPAARDAGTPAAPDAGTHAAPAAETPEVSSSSVPDVSPVPSEQPDSAQSGVPEEMPRVRVTRRRAIAFAIFVLSVVGFLYFVLPRITGTNGLGHTVAKLRAGDLWWIGVGVGFECLSFAGYIALFRVVFVREGRDQGRIGWAQSYQITMAGLAAARIFAAAGAGGVALTAWALRRSGMEARVVACRLVAFLVLLYFVYAASLVICGVGLASGIFPGGGSFALTVIPAVIGALLIGTAGAIALLPEDAERSLKAWARRSGKVAGLAATAVSVPATAASGIRTAISLARQRSPLLLGAPAWWAFDIAVLWASFHAFGQAPPWSVIWMSYFVGMFGNLLPLPGGVGGVDGGMIGAFVAFGVSLDLAVVAVLTYRAIAFWLPTVPGLIAFFQLRKTVHRWQGEISAEHEGVAALEASNPAHA